MSELAIARQVNKQLPEIPYDWSYEESVARVKPLVYTWKNLTLEIAAELWVAREILSTRAWNKGISDGTNVPSQTWAKYCESIGLEKRTANRWLATIFGPQKPPKLRPPKIQSQVIYADPPWQFQNIGFDQTPGLQYPTMSLGEICNMKDDRGRPIKKAVEDRRVVLFLWVPEALLPEGLEVMTAWGFSYKAHMVWVKDKAPGVGFWVKAKHEDLCMGCNEPDLYPQQLFDSVFEAPVTKHSQKPEKVYEMIEAMYTGPFIELFARNTRPGWEAWGNEV